MHRSKIRRSVGATLLALSLGLAPALVAQDETPTVAFPGASAPRPAASAPAPTPTTTTMAPASVGVPAPADGPAPAAAFLRSPLLQAPALNRAGTWVATLFSGGGESYVLMLEDLAAGKQSLIGGGEGVVVTSLQWLDDTHVAYNLVTVAGAELALMVVDVNAPDQAYPIYQYGTARIIGVPESEPMKPLVWVAVAGADRKPALVELDAALNQGGFVDVRGDAAEAGWAEVARRNEAQILSVVPPPAGRNQLGYIADRKGDLAFAYTSDGDRVMLHVWDGAGWLPSPLDLDTIDIADVGDDLGELIVRLPAADGKPAALHFLNATTAELGELVLQDDAYDYDGRLYRDPASHAVVGAYYDRNGPVVAWFNDQYREMQKVLNGYFPGKLVRLLDGSKSGNTLLMAVWSDREPVTYYTLDVAKRVLGRLQSERPWINPEQMQATSMVQYRTGDGKTLDAYVTLPDGATKEHKVPLVVLPHGGPWTRSTWGFDAEVQFLASRGYAVLQPNYRGSTGYDWKFTEADRVDFAGMQEDVARAVRTVLRTGLIDPQRVAISGGGFGASLALAGLVDSPELYRCGMVFAGVYDWARVSNQLGLDREKDPSYGPLFKLLGDPGQDAAKFAALSPGQRVGKLDDVVLVVRASDAGPVEAGEATALVRDLRAAQKPYEVFDLNGGMDTLGNRVALFEKIEAFLKANL